MNQEQFILAHEKQWLILEVLINPQLSPARIYKRRSKQRRRKPIELSPYEDKLLKLRADEISRADFPSLYREVCQHLSLAQTRRYSPQLIERLSFLVDRAHQVFYRHSHTYGDSMLGALINFFSHTFPQTVRNESQWLWWSSLFFYLPLVVMLSIIQIWPEFVYSILTHDIVSSAEVMYDPVSKHIGRERGSDSDTLMFGFYIFNNTSIGFRTFATGLLYGIGSIATLMFNGFYIGAIAGHLTQIGYTSTFWSFVAGHSALELTAIVLSGAAGLKLGFSLLSPGRKSRYQAMVDSARISVKIMGGAAIMFFIAAFIEAFWSSTQTVAPVIKYTVGLFLWFLVFVYFVFVGREQRE